MGTSHAYSGVALGCAVASLAVPHRLTTWELAGSAFDATGPAGLLAIIPAFLVLAVCLPGFLVPDSVIPDAPPLVLALLVLITGGAALLPDLDHPSSTVAHTLGPLTSVLSRSLDRFSLALYHATRLDNDPPNWKSGHRLITHTPVGSAGFALIAGTAVATSSIASGVVVGMVCGLLAVGVRRFLRKVLRSFPRSFRVIGTAPGLTIGSASGIAAWHASNTYSSWSWAFPLAVFLGCVIHREGDWCTNSGVPRRLWPLPEDGGTRRWQKHKAPRTFDTGKDEEKHAVRPLLAAAVLVSLAGGLTLPAAVPAVMVALGAP